MLRAAPFQWFYVTGICIADATIAPPIMPREVSHLDGLSSWDRRIQGVCVQHASIFRETHRLTTPTF